MNKKRFIIGSIAGAGMLLATMTPAFADSYTTNFDSFTPGSISGQNGWSNAVNPSIDQAIVANTSGISSFGTQSFRMSDAFTDGAFGDWVFAKSLNDAVGESGSTDGSFSPGTLQRHFEMQFDITSASPDAQQPGLHISVSPDRGDGSRMSYLRFEDGTDGMDVFFDDVQGTSNPANFVETEIASGLNRATAHTVKLTMDTLDGPSNDVVKVWIDGTLVHTGTSWENYYRFDSEASTEQSPRIVKTVIFQSRTGSGPVTNPADQGKGFLFDNFSMSSGPIPSTVTVTIAKYLNGSLATAASANSASFPMVSSWNAANIGAGSGSYSLGPNGFNNPNTYQATTSDMTQGASYTTSEVTNNINSSSNVLPIGASCQTGKTRLVGYSVGDSLADAANASTTSTAPNFTNIQANEFVIVRNESCTNPPTTFAQCDGNGWKIFNNPPFKNAGLCVAYVAQHQHNVNGSVTYTANSLVRHAIFSMNSAINNGVLFYWDANLDWYTVNVSDVNVNGNTAWFAGKVTGASQHSWVGQWLFAKVLDNSPDQISGSFATQSVAETGVSSMTNPTDGPFNVTGGNLTVH